MNFHVKLRKFTDADPGNFQKPGRDLLPYQFGETNNFSRYFTTKSPMKKKYYTKTTHYYTKSELHANKKNTAESDVKFSKQN